jgi:hypothetical protein
MPGGMNMNAEKKVFNSLIQFENGSNYEVIESITVIELLLTESILENLAFITLHFPDGLECKVRKDRISVFYENSD